MAWIIIVIVLAAGGLLWFGRRSGVKSADLRRIWPGDELVETPNLQCDRGTVFEATPEELWPWILQLGKQRAGWYAPRWVEHAVFWRRSKWAARTIKPEFQNVGVGEVLPDWGGGGLRPVKIDPPQALIYLGVRPPFDPSATPLFSWVHVLEPIDGTHTRLYVRLRGRISNPAAAVLGRIFGGFFDYLTIVVMFAGLRERLREAKKPLLDRS